MIARDVQNKLVEEIAQIYSEYEDDVPQNSIEPPC